MTDVNKINGLPEELKQRVLTFLHKCSQNAFPSLSSASAVGFTKREYLAALAFQALLINSDRSFEDRELARIAVKRADELIEALITSPPEISSVDYPSDKQEQPNNKHLVADS